MKRPPPENIHAIGKAILDYQAANECLQHEAGTALGYTCKQAACYVRRYKESRITTAFTDRLQNAVDYVRNGHPIADACNKYHVISATLCQALRQQQKATTHFQWR